MKNCDFCTAKIHNSLEKKPFYKTRLSLGIFVALMSIACAEGYYLSQVYWQKSAYSLIQDLPNVELETEPEPQEIIFHPIDSLQFGLTYQRYGLNDSTAVDIAGFEKFGETYSEDQFSIFCFRGNHQRNSPSRGIIPSGSLEVVQAWEFKTHYDGTTTNYGTWGGGAGWTGQPMAIRWSKEQKVQLGIADTTFVANDDAIEIIIGSLCGNIYFLNAETGIPTRPHLSIGNPIKGSVSIDPRKNGLLYVGQGIQHGSRIGAYVLDMFNRKEVFFINGKDNDAQRKWGAFDSNAMIDAQSGQIYWPGENGVIYSFSISDDRKVGELLKMQYNHQFLTRRGVESSMAILGQYGFFADNSGSVICMNLQTLKPVWNIFTGDDSDATIAIDMEDSGKHFLYTGNEVDRLAPVNTSYFRKIDAETGQEIWKFGRSCRGTTINGKTNSGGILSSPVIGKNSGKDLVYTLFSRVDTQNRGEFVAINKHSGEEVFSIKMDQYSWSSPVDIYDEEGNIFIFFTDVSGQIYLIDGLTGELLLKEKTSYTFESSPIIINDRIFIASRGLSILSYKLQKKSL